MQPEKMPDMKKPAVQTAKNGLYRRCIKRPMDFSLALLALILLSPVLLMTALLVRIKMGSPVLFKQDRPGMNEKIFRMIKFRTMNSRKDGNGNLLPDDMRLTGFGKMLRSTSLDELPELLNIIKGDLSIVGPRPLLIQYLPLYNDHQKRRHEVRPGLSGLAQVSGRNMITWEKRFDLDVEYVDHITFLGDWRLIFSTIKKAIAREDISSDTAVTMEAFKGSAKTED